MIIGGVISLVSVVLGWSLGLLLSYKLDVIKNFIEKEFGMCDYCRLNFTMLIKFRFLLIQNKLILIAFWCLILSF